MELNRRAMLKTTTALLAALLAGGWTWLRAAPARWVQAVRASRYPGRIQPLDERELQRPGRWLG
ncbi:MAG: hypothetical protein NTV49_14310 [Kiritimatiellaeota bacterium]|nr:hypothetical protein [Kiritimatiellota bacterium]